MQHSRGIVGRLPLIALLGANAIPLLGVLFFEWDAFGIVLLYWSENVAVGFYNVLKIALVKMRFSNEMDFQVNDGLWIPSFAGMTNSEPFFSGYGLSRGR